MPYTGFLVQTTDIIKAVQQHNGVYYAALP